MGNIYFTGLTLLRKDKKLCAARDSAQRQNDKLGNNTTFLGIKIWRNVILCSMKNMQKGLMIPLKKDNFIKNAGQIKSFEEKTHL